MFLFRTASMTCRFPFSHVVDPELCYKKNAREIYIGVKNHPTLKIIIPIPLVTVRMICELFITGQGQDGRNFFPVILSINMLDRDIIRVDSITHLEFYLEITEVRRRLINSLISMLVKAGEICDIRQE